MSTEFSIPADVNQALNQLFDYLWDAEEKDYRTQEFRTDHIYRALIVLRRWQFDPTGETTAFGGCPECGARKNDGYANIGRCHWAYCEIHRLKWCFGENLIGSWRKETEGDWRANADYLADFREVEPLP